MGADTVGETVGWVEAAAVLSSSVLVELMLGQSSDMVLTIIAMR